MPKWYEYAMGLGNPLTKGGRKRWSNIIQGTPEEHERVSTLRKEQEPLYNQLVQAGLQPGAGGAFGTAADYYRDLLSNDSKTMEQLSAPELRQFREQTIPGLSEQFAGMGAGGLSSSGFRNAAVGAGTDLSERLGAIRANLRQQGAAGLAGIGQAGLGNYSQDVVTQQGTPGLISQAAPLIGAGVGFMAGGPAGAGIGYQAGNAFTGGQSGFGRTSPYGNR